MKHLFLDCNAHIAMCEPALQAFIEINASLSGHGHPLSPSVPGRAAETAIEGARQEIADILGAEISNNIFFTSTCTQACEWGIEIFRSINKNKKFIYSSPFEHPAVAQALAKNNKNPDLLFLDTDINTKIKSNTINDSCTASIYVHNETGVIQPIFDLQTDSLFADMSQAPGKVKFPKLKDIINLDVAVFGAHKFGGPASIGMVYIKNINDYKKFGTGSRYFLDRAGTPDVCGIVATAAALKESMRTFDTRQSNMIKFRDYIEPKLEDLGFNIIAKNVERISGTTFASVPESIYSHILMHKLGELGIYIGLGSACGSVHAGQSPLLKILGKTGKDFIRISNYGDYSEKEADIFISGMKRAIRC